MNYIDSLINRITMYRLLLYYLLALVGAAMFFGAVGSLSYSPYAILLHAGLFVGLCYGLNFIFAKVYQAPTNGESSILTGLILALIVTPISSVKDVTFIAAAAGLAIASKYILAVKNKHIFNPAAIAVVLTALGPQESASWWIGSVVLMPFVLLGGLLIARKIRRNGMVFIFIGVALASTLAFAALSGHSIGTTLQNTLFHSSLFFLAFVMLTEPWTSPTTKTKRYIYAVIVGTLFAPALHVGSIYSTPELALVIGNIAAFFMSPIVKAKLRLQAHTWYGASTQDIAFIPEYAFNYKPGQYIEMTLPHASADSRGLRRYFTLASSPTEDTVRIGVRYYENGSTFKQAFQNANEDTELSVGQLGGDFTLPKDPTKKLAFVAGGIGITPFRSMVKYLDDTNDKRSVALLYAERTAEDIAYRDVFENARSNANVSTTYILSAAGPDLPHTNYGRITPELIRATIPDYLERIFYISGPQSMVIGVKKELLTLGVPRRNIKTDYFFGYA